MKLGPKLALLGAGILALAGGGLGVAAIGSASASPKPAVAHVTGATLTSAPAQVGTPTPAPPTPEPTTAGDTDNVQSGDQTATDVGRRDTEAPSAESGAAEAPGDTHADAPGQNADHACPPTCDTASGEKP